MDQPLNLSLIDESRRPGAAHVARRRTKWRWRRRAAIATTACAPSRALGQLDRCAAFDDAVVQLQDRDPLRDQGPFSELAVTGRQWSAASALSDDYLAIDGRLDQIRLRVELELAPRCPTPADRTRAGAAALPEPSAAAVATAALPSGFWSVAAVVARTAHI